MYHSWQSVDLITLFGEMQLETVGRLRMDYLLFPGTRPVMIDINSYYTKNT